MVSLPTRLLTFSLCALFFKWTAKFSALSPGPGVYSFPGQSMHLILGRNIHLIPGGVGPAEEAGPVIISVSALTAQCRMAPSKASYDQVWRRPLRASLSQRGMGG